jgi:hypothetical protein
MPNEGAAGITPPKQAHHDVVVPLAALVVHLGDAMDTSQGPGQQDMHTSTSVA